MPRPRRLVVVTLASVALASFACSGATPSAATPPTGSCSATVSPDQTSKSIAVSGGEVTIPVTAASGCNWTAATTADFIRITEGSAGAGNGIVKLLVAANSGGERAATVIVAGTTVTVTQQGRIAQPVLTLLEFTSGRTFGGFACQSLRPPGAAAYNNIHFNFYQYSAPPPGTPHTQKPLGYGYLYIFTQEYRGTPDGLRTATAGLVGRSDQALDRVNFGPTDEFAFPPDVTILGGVQYWFCGDVGYIPEVSDGDVYPDGDYYSANGGTFAYNKNPQKDANFRLRASVKVPQ
jgi:hypothetical protein